MPHVMQNSSCHLQSDPSNVTRITVETTLIAHAQSESFHEEFQVLKSGKEIPPHSHLSPLSPEFDQTLGVIRVGGRLRQTTDLEMDSVHPMVLDHTTPY